MATKVLKNSIIDAPTYQYTPLNSHKYYHSQNDKPESGCIEIFTNFVTNLLDSYEIVSEDVFGLCLLCVGNWEYLSRSATEH